VRVSGLELGGLVGSLIAGRLSDYLIAKDKSGTGGNVGKRVQVSKHRVHMSLGSCPGTTSCMQCSTPL
jgi:hypothetical protein